MEKVTECRKSDWKKLVKGKINEKIEKDSKEKRKGMKKLRRQMEQKFEKQRYVMEKGVREVSELMRTKFDMWDMGKNMGGDRKCIGCEEKETMDHVIECREVEKKMKRKGERRWLESGDTKIMENATKYIKTYIIIIIIIIIIKHLFGIHIIYMVLPPKT